MKNARRNAKSAGPSRIGFRALLCCGVSLLLSACGSGPSGEYSDEMGILSYDFQSGGKVYMSTLGMQFAGEYEMDDDKIIVKGPNGNMVLEMGEDDTLQGPMGMVLRKKKE